MFERYTEPARLTIFYARAVAFSTRTPSIEPIHLLQGLMWRDTFRANVLFDLRRRFPQYVTLKETTLWASIRKELPLTLEAKKILGRSVIEADVMGDAWVDTDHLLLGILCEAESQAAQQLIKAGITLESARAVALQNRPSRPDYGPIIPPGQAPSLKVWLRSKWCLWNAGRSERKFAAQRQNR